MRGMSPDAAALYATGAMASHEIATRVEIWAGDVLVAVPIVTGGSVTVDGDASIRRRCSVTIIDPAGDLIPRTPGDVLYPGATELRVWRGIRWPDGRAGISGGSGSDEPGVELFPLGTFLLIETVVSDAGAGVTLTLNGFDNSKRVERNAWESPYYVADGSSGIDTWTAILTDRYPAALTDVRLGVDVTLAKRTLGDKPQANPWEDLVTLAQALGCRTFVNVEGFFVLAPILDPATLPIVANYVVGNGTRLIGVERRLDAEKGFNRVIVETSPTGGAVSLRGIASDTNPDSATYIDGPYGPVPLFIGNSAAASQAQVDAEAAAVLARKQAASDAVTLDIFANPCHEVGDIITVEAPSVNIDAVFQLDSFSVPLDSGASMKASVRRVT
jgi:hypothetical protein